MQKVNTVSRYIFSGVLFIRLRSEMTMVHTLSEVLGKLRIDNMRLHTVPFMFYLKKKSAGVVLKSPQFPWNVTLT